MAIQRLGKILTEQHRLEQISVKAQIIKATSDLFPLIDNAEDDGILVDSWIDFMVRIILRWRKQSFDVSKSYYLRFRDIELHPELDTPDPEIRYDDISDDEAAYEISLMVTGPQRMRQLRSQNKTNKVVNRFALKDVSGAASRHALNGGRKALEAAVIADPVAVGWARVTDSDPCAFCAMLASRGFAYKTEQTALHTTNRARSRPLGQKYHDNCGCTVEPAFTRNAELPGKSKEFADLWVDSTIGFSGNDAVNAFRRAYEGREEVSR